MAPLQDNVGGRINAPLVQAEYQKIGVPSLTQGAMNGAPTVPLAGGAFMRPWPRPNTKK